MKISRFLICPSIILSVIILIILKYRHRNSQISLSIALQCTLIIFLMIAIFKPFFLYRKEIKPVNPKGNQSWIFIGRTDVETETPILSPPDAKNWLPGKDLDAGQDWRQEKGMTEDEMVGWHHWLGLEFEQAPGIGDGQGSLACCSPWGCKESDMTEPLNWIETQVVQW